MADIETTLEDRGNRYGSMAENSNMTQSFMRILQASGKYHELSDVHIESLHMIFHKISRMVCGDSNYIDNAHDIAGYAVLLEKYLISLNTVVKD